MDKIIRILKKDTVLVVSGLIALATSFVIPPSLEYFSYIDFKVLAVLFSLMAVIAAIREMGVFEVVAGSLLKWTGSVRSMSLALVMLAFFSSMLITNDVALITFVPLAIEVLRRAGKGNLIFVVTMQTIAANLGSMLTPIGNPQNLYLYSRFGVSAVEFFSISIPLVIVSFILVTGLTLTSGNDTVSFELTNMRILEDKRRIAFYIILFIVCLLSVFGFVDHIVMLAAVTAGIALTSGGVLKKVDYALLLTFVFFFIIVGNVGRMGAVVESLGSLIRGRELFSSVVLSQVISNVPAAIMLSSFTENYRMLIAGTNIGGLGTLVASLASLISYKLYSRSEGAKPFAYLKKFSLLNAAALSILSIFAVFWF
ncbi:SLC13 family permease [Youngiibacter multivorans]|uniref:Na+/H+ antiporter NhaD/arsenite permease-like protein n=1 Tax=Youngiibacter multivorans TaxID=937251 RepID=A0ABS4G0F4_9CLOT|nr:SLC13 family permease [Youngiibacter multivorans]MBP1918027.1 Na+/H+ antiporter NhaD/arsenite permease-like protein [Youngiibacter multivorans]